MHTQCGANLFVLPKNAKTRSFATLTSAHRRRRRMHNAHFILVGKSWGARRDALALLPYTMAAVGERLGPWPRAPAVPLSRRT